MSLSSQDATSLIGQIAENTVVQTSHRPEDLSELAQLMPDTVVITIERSVHGALTRLNRDEAPGKGTVVLMEEFPNSAIGCVRFVSALSKAIGKKIVIILPEDVASEHTAFISQIQALPARGVYLVLTPYVETAWERNDRLRAEQAARHQAAELLRIKDVPLSDERRAQHLAAGVTFIADVCATVLEDLNPHLSDTRFSVEQRGEAARLLEGLDPAEPDAMLRLAAACAALGITLEDKLIHFSTPMAA